MHVHQRTAAFIAAFAAATVLAGTMVAASAETTPAPPQAHGTAPTSGAQYAVANDVLIQGVVGNISGHLGGLVRRRRAAVSFRRRLRSLPASW